MTGTTVGPETAREAGSLDLADLQDAADDAVTSANALWLLTLGYPHAPEGAWRLETIQLMALASAGAARHVAEQVVQLRAKLVMEQGNSGELVG